MDSDFAAYDSSDGGNFAFVDSNNSLSMDVSVNSSSPSHIQSRVQSIVTEYSPLDLDTHGSKFESTHQDSYSSQQNNNSNNNSNNNDMQAPAAYQNNHQNNHNSINNTNNNNNSSQSDVDRQAMYTHMQERFQMQQDGQQSGLMDRCWHRRKDILKLVIMALVILLALSSHSVMLHYVKTYVENTTLSPSGELMYRASYPIGVLVLLWIIKGSQTQSLSQRA